MPEDAYAQQRQQICAIFWFVGPSDMNRVYMAWERMAMVSCQWMIDLKMVAFAIVRKLSDRIFCSLGMNP